jgi:SAM-dependent methyltransferase
VPLEFEAPRHVERTDLCHFYHTMDLPEIGTVTGQWDLRGRFDDYVSDVPFEGKTVLDIGTASGFLTFEAEKRGAKVTSFDISDAKFQHLLPFKNKLYFRDHREWRKQQNAGIELWKNAYWLAHRLLKSKANVFYGNIYDLPAELGTFDTVIIGSVLEHLSDQISALASVSRHVKSELIIVTPVIETESYIAEFIGRAANPEADYTWWIYSSVVYADILNMLGFKIGRITKKAYPCVIAGADHERHTIVATRI